MAGDGAAGLGHAQRRHAAAAQALRQRAARVEGTARGPRGGVRRLALQQDAGIERPPRHRDRGHQRLGIGVARLGEDLFGRALLDDPAEIHHRDPVGEVAHHLQVVADEDHAKALLPLQVAQQVHHLRLDRDVERRDRLVTDQKRRIGGQRPRDHHALALPARELVRIAPALIGAQPDRGHQRGGAGRALLRRADAVDVERLADLRGDRQPPVKRRERVLPDHLHARPQPAPDRGAEARQGHALEQHRAALRRVKAQQHPPERRLARARLADDAQRLARAQLQADLVDGADLGHGAGQAAAGTVDAHQIARLEKRGPAHVIALSVLKLSCRASGTG
ncbi:hypothetical protein SDC9_43180 [bioreactor metagenome]|uniref:Uncharacterized protein n=1 Tax=bioreactor metagenome TaxID=1076179 RepID=A0A644W3F4_9ZZZZ